jgi:hypothetical protein
LVWLVLVALAASPVFAVTAEEHVERFLRMVRTSLGSPEAGRRELLQGVYTGAFDLPALARRVIPESVWLAATVREREEIAEMLACRLATETEKRGLVEAPANWVRIGSRAENGRHVVAVRLDDGNDRQETVLFEVMGTGDEVRILDLRSGHGRLSGRLSDLILRDGGMAAPPQDIESWLTILACETPR